MSDQTQDADQPEAVEASRPRPRKRRWLPALLLALAGAGVIAAWKMPGDRQYWAAVVRQRTLSPVCDPHEVMGQPSIELAQRRVSPGFDLRSLTIPRGEILPGGVGKDGIPALTHPLFVDARQGTFMKPTDRVIGIELGGQSRAYPLKILAQHEVVNDRVGGVPVAVTYCPLCDSVAAFDRRTELGEREFGVSGLLYNSNVLIYDRGEPSESLWSQMMTRGVSGSAGGRFLKALPVELTNWRSWRARHPHTALLSAQTGFNRDYDVNPYGRYFASPAVMFPVHPASAALPAKARVLGVWAEGHSRAYPLSVFPKAGQPVEQQLAGHPFTLQYDADADSLRVEKAGEGLQWVYAFWFAWYAFHPGTEVFHPGQ